MDNTVLEKRNKHFKKKQAPQKGAFSRFYFFNNGNLSSDGQRNYKYDYNNRLIEVNIGTGNLVKYTYDILGRRTKKIDSSKSSTNPESTIYVYAGDNILSEYKTYGVQVGGTGSLVPITLKKNYINSIGTDGILAYDAEELISPTGTGKTTNRYYYHTNQLGSVIALTNSTGAIMQTYSYDAFGKAYVRNGSGSGTTLISLDTYTGSTYSNSRLYTGREYDKEINLYYLRARYYNQNTGKFISRDPIGQNDQVNLYTYVGNSPLGYTDRNGKEKNFIIYFDRYLELEGYVSNPAFYLLDSNTQSVIRKELADNEAKAKRIHYNRNLLNTNTPSTADEAKAKGWKQPNLLGSEIFAALYHQHDTSLFSPNIKYVDVDGHKEIIFDSNGQVVNSVENEGTYNFFDPTNNPDSHKLYDIKPYSIWGNSPNDSTWSISRYSF